MLQPKKTKHRKWQKGRSLNRGIITKGFRLVHGILGLKSLESRILTDKQIEAAWNEIRRTLGNKGRVWLRIFPHKPITKKPPEVRMGGGKGDVVGYGTLVRPGTILFEVDGSDKNLLLESLNRASYKLPIKVKIVSEE
jgi:large subunit ribosomal protein L16